MPHQTPFIEAAVSALLKLLPGILGSIVALRIHQEQTSFLSRAFVFGSSVILSAYFGPAINEGLSIHTPYRQAAVCMLVGLFGLFVVGEIVKAIKEMGLGAIARDALRRILGIGGKE